MQKNLLSEIFKTEDDTESDLEIWKSPNFQLYN